MELKIELDMSKIDYETINKQIQEKIEALDIEKMYDITSKIDYEISSLIQNKVDYNYNEYIDDYWNARPTSEGKKLIQSMCKEEIEKRTNKAIEEVFTNDLNEDGLREIILKLLPDIFAHILFKKIENTLFTETYRYEDKIMDMVRNEINYKFDQLKYNL